MTKTATRLRKVISHQVTKALCTCSNHCGCQGFEAGLIPFGYTEGTLLPEPDPTCPIHGRRPSRLVKKLVTR